VFGTSSQAQAGPAGRRQIEVANDNSLFIDRSVKNVYHTIGEAIVLVALVIFVFLRTVRASIIPIVTIPVSLIGAFALMAAFGFTINTLTLLALVLAIGLVVDDAIVMLENIYRHIEEGLDPFSAAIKGAREIGFAVITMTLTLVAVYAPLAFTPGAHRAAVHRIRAGAGRGGAGVGLRRADADADDVFAAAQAQPQAQLVRPHHGALAHGFVRPLRPGPALGAAKALATGAGQWAVHWAP
jgi:hypothetical protein